MHSAEARMFACRLTQGLVTNLLQILANSKEDGFQMQCTIELGSRGGMNKGTISTPRVTGDLKYFRRHDSWGTSIYKYSYDMF